MVKKKAVSVFALAAAVALCLLGCSSGEAEKSQEAVEPVSSEPQAAVEAGNDEPEEEAELIVESGFSQDAYGGVNVGMLIENPSDSVSFESTAMIVTVKDADGNVIATDPEFKIGSILPGEKFGFGISLHPDEGAVPASVDVSYKAEQKAAEDTPRLLTVDQVNKSELGYLGEFTNENDDTYSTVMVGVLLFDESGAIIGGGYEDYNEVASGTLPFEVYSSLEGAESSAEAYAHIYRV